MAENQLIVTAATKFESADRIVDIDLNSPVIVVNGIDVPAAPLEPRESSGSLSAENTTSGRDSVQKLADVELAESTRLRDLVKVLERKVLALEDQLKDSNERHVRDKEAATEDLQKKNAVMDKMRIKLNRYEFAVKEAILFLSKPMEAYEVWLTQRNTAESANSPQSPNSPNVLLMQAIAGTMAQANQSAGTPLTPPPSIEEKTLPAIRSLKAEPARSRAVSGARPASSNLVPLKDTQRANSSVAIVTDKPPLSPSLGSSSTIPSNISPSLEIQCLECMRLALNYLKNAQHSVQAMMDGSLPSTAQLPKLMPENIEKSPTSTAANQPKQESKVEANPAENVSGVTCSACKGSGKCPTTSPGTAPTTPEVPQQRPASASNSPSSQGGGSSTPSMPHNGLPATAANSKARQAALARLASPERKMSTLLANQALMHAAEAAIEDGDGDIGDIVTTGNSSSSSKAAAKKCSNCRELMLQVDHQTDTINGLREDVTKLVNQLEEERALRDRVQLSKDILDQELEELTAQLFDQANRMVIDEAKMRDELETNNRDLRGELKALVKQFETREDELKDLRRNLRALEAAKLRSSNRSTTASPMGSLGNLASSGLRGSSSALASVGGPIIPRASYSHQYYAVMSLSAPTSAGPIVIIDGVLFAEFQDHVKQTMLAASLPQAQAIAASQNTNFMKRCMVEDVEPSLFYSYTAYQSSSGIFANGKGNNGIAPLRRKLMDGFMKGTIEVGFVTKGPENESTASLQRGAAGGIKAKCHSCTLTRDCDFRLCFTDKPDPTTPNPAPTTASATTTPSTVVESYPLCRLCRDRVIAVVDFFGFLRSLGQPRKQQSAGLTILGMFRHATWLRRRMAAARVGSSPLYEAESLLSIDRGKGDGEWERAVQIMN